MNMWSNFFVIAKCAWQKKPMCFLLLFSLLKPCYFSLLCFLLYGVITNGKTHVPLPKLLCNFFPHKSVPLNQAMSGKLPNSNDGRLAMRILDYIKFLGCLLWEPIFFGKYIWKWRFGHIVLVFSRQSDADCQPLISWKNFNTLTTKR